MLVFVAHHVYMIDGWIYWSYFSYIYMFYIRSHAKKSHSNIIYYVVLRPVLRKRCFQSDEEISPGCYMYEDWQDCRVKQCMRFDVNYHQIIAFNYNCFFVEKSYYLYNTVNVNIVPEYELLICKCLKEIVIVIDIVTCYYDLFS